MTSSLGQQKENKRKNDIILPQQKQLDDISFMTFYGEIFADFSQNLRVKKET